MAERETKSVKDILAACRTKDGGTAAGAEPSATSSQPAAAAESRSGEAAAPVAKKPSQMSVQEMLAAARAEKAKKAGDATAQAAPTEESRAAAPAASPAAGKDPKKMSVAEMLAAARAEKGGAKAAGGGTESAVTPKPTPPAKAPAAEKPAVAKPAAGKPTAKAAGEGQAAAAKAASGTLDTASILAAARGATKPGPVSKAEAAARTEAPAPAAKTITLPPRPEKPAYAMPRPAAPAADAEDRRGFFATLAGVFVGSSLAVGFSALALTNLLWVLGLARFMFPNILTEPPTKFKVGFPDNFAPGQVETKYIAQFGAWIVRAEYDGVPQIFALQAVCTHLGCTPNWLEGEQKFKCPCHGSGFYKDGINFEGPAPRPLERYAIRVADDGQLEVDKSRRFKEEIGQWQDAASFVPV